MVYSVKIVLKKGLRLLGMELLMRCKRGEHDSPFRVRKDFHFPLKKCNVRSSKGRPRVGKIGIHPE
ncbi:hypothetical protein [Robertmurraya sp. 2P01SA]|uniref:hypothetical protein n=1 Tax=Robertmurraya TaxID=2837507 RepID=UPI0039A566AC